MTIYLGVVNGKTVVLPPEAEFPDGAVVEVRLVGSGKEAPPDEAADHRVQAALVTAGLLERIRPLGAASPLVERPLLRLAGGPVSETIITDRR